MSTATTAATVASDISCVICFAPVVDNLQCRQCAKGFCEPCLTSWLAQTPSCPSCRFDGPAPFAHSAELQTLADASNVPCEFGCGVVHRWADRAAHRTLCDHAKLPCPFKPCTFVGPSCDVDLHAFKCPHARALELSTRVQAVLDEPYNQAAPLSMTAMKNLLGKYSMAHATGPAAAATAAEDGTVVHVVRTTDTLQGLALRYGTDRESLRRLNKIARDVDLHAHHSIRVPALQPTAGDAAKEGASQASPANDTDGNAADVSLETLLALQKRNAIKSLVITMKCDAPEAMSYLHLNDYCFTAAQDHIKADRTWEAERARSKPKTLAQFAKQAQQERRANACAGCQGMLCSKQRACERCKRVFCKVCCAKYGECARVVVLPGKLSGGISSVCNACFSSSAK